MGGRLKREINNGYEDRWQGEKELKVDRWYSNSKNKLAQSGIKYKDVAVSKEEKTCDFLQSGRIVDDISVGLCVSSNGLPYLSILSLW